ncbi:hypothetical protein D3C81_1370820 [compost metagenome]
MQGADRKQRQPGTEVNPNRACQQKCRPTFGQQTRIDLRHQNEPRRIDAEQPTEMLGRDTVEVDEDER